jgi:hypothetical protein
VNGQYHSTYISFILRNHSNLYVYLLGEKRAWIPAKPCDSESAFSLHKYACPSNILVSCKLLHGHCFFLQLYAIKLNNRVIMNPIIKCQVKHQKYQVADYYYSTQFFFFLVIRLVIYCSVVP